ncbi:rod shape-determining protein [candidate division CSSED10-310 bacterium]|uniref:Cell shape-determining protein MreB n=1 Tax=candidate division CSSED10-310 bacterium TaxID=2855610 RepID=A0ABV6YT22_UNCC1
MRKTVFKKFSQDLAIDLGTANTLVYVKGRGVIVNEPSIVAVITKTNKMLAVGHEAKEMLGRTPGSIVAIRPMKDGVIADFEVTELMLRYFFKKASNYRVFFKPRVVIGVPSRITPVERKAVINAAQKAGARAVYLIEEPMAAAIGAGLPITEPSGSMIVDIGGGTTEVAVISLSGIVYSISIQVAGNRLDHTIVNYVRRKYNLDIGERTAEKIKIAVGSAVPQENELASEIKGRDLVVGLPRTIKVTDTEIREALSENLETIVEAVKTTLERTPPELASDIVDRGITMAGGGSMIRDLDLLIQQRTGLHVQRAEDPLLCVALGTSKVLDDLDLLEKVTVHG